MLTEAFAAVVMNYMRAIIISLFFFFFFFAIHFARKRLEMDIAQVGIIVFIK